MEQSPSCKANCFSASQEIPHLLCNPKVHYCLHQYRVQYYVYKILPQVLKHTVNQFTFYHPYFLKMYFSIIIHTHTSFPWPRYSNLYCVCNFLMCATSSEFILISSSWYLTKSTDYQILHYTFLQPSAIYSLTETLHILLDCLSLCSDKNIYEFASLQIPITHRNDLQLKWLTVRYF
jgi:hypothetical protein